MCEPYAVKIASTVPGWGERGNSFPRFDFIRAVLRKVPRKHHKEIAEILNECLNDAGRLQEYAVQLDERGHSRTANTIHRFHHGLKNYRSFPPEFWKMIRTTNILERVNKELKHRSRMIGAFPKCLVTSAHRFDSH